MEEQIQHRKSLDEIFNDTSEKPSMTVEEYFQKEEDQKSFIEKHHLNEPINVFAWILIFIFVIVTIYVGYKIFRLIGKLYNKLDRWLDKNKEGEKIKTI